MNELKIVQDTNLVRSVRELEAHLEKELIPSIGRRAVPLQLLPHEVYFMKYYTVRYNVVNTEYERAQFIYQDGDQEESVEWVVLSVPELLNDMTRGAAKRGVLTEGEVVRMLNDRRLVPEYDPILGYYKALTNLIPPDDKTDYIDQFASYLTVEGGDKENARWRTNFKKALVRTVKCAVDERYFNKHALILYSTNQSVGKTSYIRALFPKDLLSYTYQGSLDTGTDSQTVLAKNFIINLDELADLSRKDINSIKAMMSQLMINIRLPYARTFVNIPRRASFFGSTNRTDFLSDSENVRWLVFSVEDIDRSYGDIFTGKFNIDINKIWAQAYKLYLSGYSCELTKEDLSINEDNNILYSATSLEKEVLNSYLLPATHLDTGKKGYGRGQSTDLFELCCKKLEEDGKIHSLKNMKQSLFFIELGRTKGWKKTSFRVEGRPVSGYHYIDIQASKGGDKELPF